MSSTPRKQQPWRPGSDEDRLLEAWHARRRANATVHTDIKLGGRGKRSRWPESKQRRLDGLIVRPGLAPGIFRRHGFIDRLRDGPPISSVEVLEVDVGLTEEAIGQAIAGVALWQGQYGIEVDGTRILTCQADPALLWACDRLGIEVEVEEIEREKRASRVSNRRPYTFDEARMRRLDAYRRRTGGTYVTKIPLGGDEAGVHGWEGSAEVYLSLLRVPDGPLDAIALYDTPDRLFALVEDRAVEVVEVRREVRRGTIGKVLTHALMLEAQYELTVARKVVVCEVCDDALEWVCARVGVDVERA
jgi:hypothetical protein